MREFFQSSRRQLVPRVQFWDENEEASVCNEVTQTQPCARRSEANGGQNCQPSTDDEPCQLVGGGIGSRALLLARRTSLTVRNISPTV